MRWRFVFSEMAHRSSRNLTMTIATILTIWIALDLLGAALLMHQQINATKDYWFGKIQVSVFLTKDVTPACSATRSREPAADHLRCRRSTRVFYESQGRGLRALQGAVQDVPALVKNTDPGGAAGVLPRQAEGPEEVPDRRLRCAEHAGRRPGRRRERRR